MSGEFGIGAATASLVLAGLTLTTPQAAAQDWSECLQGSSDTQATFERAARVSGVPEDVLLARRLPRLAVEPERRRAEHVGRLRRHAPDRPGR